MRSKYLSLILLIFTLCATQGQCLALSPISEIQVLGKITTSSKNLSLLDLCDPATIPEDWKAVMSRVDIGEAPSAGSEKIVNPEQLKAYLDRFLESNGLPPSQVKLYIPDRISVVRSSINITQNELEEIFRQFVLDNSPWPQQDTTIQKITFSGLPVLPAGQVTHEVVASPKERFVGNVAVTVNFYVDGEKARSLSVTGKVEVSQNVYHAARALRQNDIVTAADLEMQRISIEDAPDRFATQPEQIINKRVLRNVGIHQPIDLKVLDKPLAIKRGDAVTIVYNQPGLQLSAKGQVKEDGSVGDTVRVSNSTSNKIIFCRVLDSQTVAAAR